MARRGASLPASSSPPSALILRGMAHICLFAHAQSRRCGVTTLGARDAARVLGSARVAFVGDSIVRETLRALGDLVATRDAPPPDFLRHAHAAAATPCGGELLFRWRPFADNATAELRERAGAVPPPEVAAPGGAVDARPLDTLVLGVGLWDVLHTRDVSTYAAALKTTFGALETLLREPVRPYLSLREPECRCRSSGWQRPATGRLRYFETALCRLLPAQGTSVCMRPPRCVAPARRDRCSCTGPPASPRRVLDHTHERLP